MPHKQPLLKRHHQKPRYTIMAAAAAARVNLTDVMLESFKDNASAFVVLTTTDVTGVVHITPNTILQADATRLSDLPMNRLLSLLLEVEDSAVLEEGTNEKLGLVAVLLPANDGGGDAVRAYGSAVRSSAGLSSSWWLTPPLQAPLDRTCDAPYWAILHTFS